MSYDVWLEVDTGGPEPAQVGRDLNYTANCSPMWRQAGADIGSWSGMPAAPMIPFLRTAIVNMEDNPDVYRRMNPGNGHGRYETCLEFLRSLLAEFVKHPRATVRVSR